jgi:hypothetical protein
MKDVSPADKLPGWLKLGAQIRGRFEAPSGTSLANGASDDYYASRIRVSLLLRPVSWLNFFAEAQDARIAGSSVSPAPTTLYNPMDLRQGYIALKHEGVWGVQAKAGRQDVAFGGERLIGPADWGMSRTFDAVASLEEVSASTQEINSVASRNTENASASASLATQSEAKFAAADASLEQMVKVMDEINTAGGKIAQIVRVIEEVAFQTNILALNAAVEAARAGEAGLGFAVVADEVRSLAQRCAQSAKDTAALIEDSAARAGRVNEKVREVAGAFKAITADSGRVKTLAGEVCAGSEEQVRGLGEIAKAIVQMEQATQTTAAGAEQGAAAAEELLAQSQTLETIVSTLKVTISGEVAR